MDQLKKFQKILFKSPDYKLSLALITIFSLIFGFLSGFFDRFPLIINPRTDTFIYAIFLFLLPTVIYSFITNIILKRFNLDRSFLLGLINQLLVFASIVISLGTNRLVASILGILYSINIFAITGTEGKKGIMPILIPLIYFIPVINILNRFVVFNISYVFILYIIGLGIALMGSIYITEYFFHLNIPDISAVKMISSFINDDIATVYCGTKIDTPIQKIKFQNKKENFKIVIPWLHPGPIKGFGGGSMSTEVINMLNKNKKGFFWHFPSSHEDDPVNPEINERVFKKEGKYKVNKKSSKILNTTSGKFTIYGQKFNNFYLFILEGRKKDDYDSTIFREIRNILNEKVVFVDTHNHAPFSDVDPNIVYGEREAIRLKKSIIKLKERLDQEKLYEFKISTYVSDKLDFSIINQEIDGKKYLYITLDSNGISEELTKKLYKYRNEKTYDEMIFLTTDAHNVSDFIIKEKNINLEVIDSSIIKTEKKLSKGKISFMEEILEDVKVLKDDWHKVIASLNYMFHFFPVAIIVIYIAFLYLTFNFPI